MKQFPYTQFDTIRLSAWNSARFCHHKWRQRQICWFASSFCWFPLSRLLRRCMRLCVLIKSLVAVMSAFKQQFVNGAELNRTQSIHCVVWLRTHYVSQQESAKCTTQCEIMSVNGGGFTLSNNNANLNYPMNGYITPPLIWNDKYKERGPLSPTPTSALCGAGRNSSTASVSV